MHGIWGFCSQVVLKFEPETEPLLVRKYFAYVKPTPEPWPTICGLWVEEPTLLGNQVDLDDRFRVHTCICLDSAEISPR